MAGVRFNYVAGRGSGEGVGGRRGQFGLNTGREGGWLSVAHRGGRHNEAEATLHLLLPPPVGRLSVPGAGVVRAGAVMKGSMRCRAYAAQSNR